jgi:hypothetical protein
MKSQMFALMMLITSVVSAQKFSAKGQLVDTLSGPLPSATVMLLNAKDSSLVNFTVTDVQGNFLLKNISKGEYLFKVSFMGFRTFTQKLATPEMPVVIELGQIKLEPISKELEAIEIAADRAPVTVKRDTIEFNAGSFKTKQNAVVEDLLKKLPGVEVDNEGNVTAQGEQVKRVTVDGKNFFGTDPKLATKNLPADAVDKVQVFDKKSDQAAFSGIDDGQREKTINLALKEEKRNGAFGIAMAGIGTDERMQGRLSLNRFSKSRQLSLLAMGNNVNQQGFSMDDYMNFTGGSQQMMAGGGQVRLEFNSDNSSGVPLNFGNRANGIMTNYAGGLNVNNEFSDKTEVNGSYFYNYLDHDKDQTTNRENFLPNGSYTFNQRSRQQNSNANHRLNATLDHKIDSMNSVKLTASIALNDTDTHLRSFSETITGDNLRQNESNRLSLASGTTTSVTGSLLWRHKFNKKGRTFSTTLQYSLSDSDREGYLAATNSYYSPESESSIVQTSTQSTLANSYGANVSFTEPLGKRKYLEANYSFRENLNDVDRRTYDENSGEPILNNALSNQYNSDYQYHRAGLNFRMVKPKYNIVAGASLQNTNLSGELINLNAYINRSFENVLPSVHVNYDFSNTKHIRFDYETSVQEPSIQQLQPVVDNSDPLNIYNGNPNLQPAYAQSWRVNFMTFNPISFVNFFSFIDIDQISNSIVNSQNIDDNLVRVTQPENVGQTTRLNSTANFGFPINKLGSRFNLGVNYRGDRSIALLNDTENKINQNTYGGTIRYTYRYKEIFDLSLSADVDKQLTKYEFNQPDQHFVNETYNAESNLTFLKNFQFSGSFEYLIYNSKSTNFYQSIPLLNLSLSKFILKNKAGELKLGVNNVLDKALGVSQTASVNYLERQTTNSLGRYFMVSFTYALNKQLNPMGMRQGRGGIRIMR